jgi:hypothetical protein
MKKILAVLVLVLFGTIAFAQWSPGPVNMYNMNTGNVGISNGAAFTPLYLLDVAKNSTGTAVAVRNLGGAGGAQFIMYDGLYSAEWRFKSFTGGGFKIRDNNHATDVVVFEPATAAAANALYVKSNGNVGIGTTNPAARLAVNGTGTFNGKVKCTEVEVLLAAWPDFVFESGYNLRPLSEVENFINTNKHLPDVPSANEVTTNGASLGQMNSTLLQKVEELTLYMIQLQKENDALKVRVSNLEK